MAVLTVCIPTYEMKGLGVAYLRHSFDMLAVQTYTDFDIVVSDHSTNTDIEDLCRTYAHALSITYIKNTANRGSSSANINNAIVHAKGSLIKLLFQDDFLFNERSLEETVEAFDLDRDTWLVTACIHTHDGTTMYRPYHPRYTRDIHLGNNTLSSPSVLTIKNDSPLLFDEQLIWLMDCEYYKRYHDRFGMPKILNTITVVNRIGEHQVSNTLATTVLRKKEFDYVLEKYEQGMTRIYYRCIYAIRRLIKLIRTTA